MMQQYYDLKKQYPNTIMFFRLGDFYEMFDQDAKVASRVLEIALTSREAGPQGRIPMCGIPHHAAEGYLNKLIANGYRVAICEQIEDPKEAKGVVKRDVVRVVTPGTFLEGQGENAENRYLVAVAFTEQKWGIASLDLSTGEFSVTSLDDLGKVEDELLRLQPAEIVLPFEMPNSSFFKSVGQRINATITILEGQQHSLARANGLLFNHFGLTTLIPFGIEKIEEIIAASLALDYVQSTQKAILGHIRSLNSYSLEEFLQIDGHSRQNLELIKTIRDGKKRGSLLGVLDFTVTSMGTRLLRGFLEKPLVSLSAIEKRHDAVEYLVDDTSFRLELKELLAEIYDLERLVGRLVVSNGNARDLKGLANSLAKIPQIKAAFPEESSPLLQEVEKSLNPLESFVELINGAIVDEPGLTIREGNLIRDGFNDELDQLRRASRGGKDWIRDLENLEREKTGIKSLKVGYNRVFGYYLEVTNANAHLVPENYQRKQTLANAERYITPELKEQEALILGAEERINELEYELFVSLREQVKDYIDPIQINAHSLAKLDVLQSLATAAVEHTLVRPQMFADSRLAIEGGRHPVIEAIEGQFVPNDVYFDANQQIILLTGPNMAGKSTYLRQVALIVILGQIGSFIPAEAGQIGIVDRIFTRIGASDDLSTGQSTFMVECSETAQLLLNATERSLIILDELGRGTSTFDGMAIAQAVIEHIHTNVGARTLFSTHFHELTKLEYTLHRLVSYRVEVEEKDGQVYFLHKVSRGTTDKSYGINVARMAGIPPDVLRRSWEILYQLEAGQGEFRQLDLFETFESTASEFEEDRPIKSKASKVEQDLAKLDLNNLTPLEALQTLVVWQNELKGKEGTE